MNDIDEISRELRDQVSRLLVPLQTRKAIDQAAFDALEQCVRNLARKLKGSELLPRAALNELKVTIGVLRAESQHAGSEAPKLVGMSNRLEMVFDLILRGESPDDRIPGVPRII
ncbi:MAG TPA: hypothetical protein VH328_10935 [Burkholderiaceae bacterium]|jgi:hypothetical protein|nr:hypothetical protein [Burkholderiaceae bacterium]